MYRKILISGIVLIMLSGCTAGFRPALDDYEGSDAARIRIGAEGNTALQFYEKQISGCYKKVLERRVTSGFAIIGIPVTGNKRLANMPMSNNIKGPFINEFTIKPGLMIRVVHYASTQSSFNFIPQVNHNYDILVTGSLYSGDSVSVKDLNPKAELVTWDSSKIRFCPQSVFD